MNPLEQLVDRMEAAMWPAPQGGTTDPDTTTEDADAIRRQLGPHFDVTVERQTCGHGMSEDVIVVRRNL